MWPLANWQIPAKLATQIRVDWPLASELLRPNVLHPVGAATVFAAPVKTVEIATSFTIMVSVLLRDCRETAGPEPMDLPRQALVSIMD
jgi:hypothetical protein